MKIEIGDTRIRYRIEIYGKYSVIAGDSGTGKTTLFELIQDYNDNPKLVKCRSDLPLVAIDRRAKDEILREYEDCLLVMDEDCRLLKQYNVASLLQESNNYFLIISRKNMNWLPLSVDNYYKLEYKNGINYNIPKYKRHLKEEFFRVAQIVTEDQESGRKFFEEYFTNIPVSSAHSKSELVDYLEKKQFEGKTLVVYDAAAFAYEMERMQRYMEGKNIEILDWECFEHFILKSKPFGLELTQKDCDCFVESLEQLSAKQLEQMISYTKSSLGKCLRKQSGCSKCENISMCNFKHERIEFDLRIEGE